MMKWKKATPAEPQNINMIPMIDVILNLLIFLMLTNEISAVKSEDLPRVSEAKPDEGEAGRTMISIDKDGLIRWGARYISLDELDGLLKVLAEMYKQQGAAFSEKPILIRADRQVKFGVIQEIMVRCVKRKIYKLSFGARLTLEENMIDVKEMTP